MISEKSYDRQTGPVYQDDGFTIDTRPSYPSRPEQTECPEGTTSESNVIAQTMGPGYPEVLEGASEAEGSSKNPVNISTNNSDVKTDLVASQPRRLD